MTILTDFTLEPYNSDNFSLDLDAISPSLVLKVVAIPDGAPLDITSFNATLVGNNANNYQLNSQYDNASSVLLYSIQPINIQLSDIDDQFYIEVKETELGITKAYPIPVIGSRMATSGTVVGPDVVASTKTVRYHLENLFPKGATYPVGGYFDVVMGDGEASITPDGLLTGLSQGSLLVTYIHPQFKAITKQVSVLPGVGTPIVSVNNKTGTSIVLTAKDVHAVDADTPIVNTVNGESGDISLDAYTKAEADALLNDKADKTQLAGLPQLVEDAKASAANAKVSENDAEASKNSAEQAAQTAANSANSSYTNSLSSETWSNKAKEYADQAHLSEVAAANSASTSTSQATIATTGANKATAQAKVAEAFANSLSDAIRNGGYFDPASTSYPKPPKDNVPYSWFSTNNGQVGSTIWSTGDLLVCVPDPVSPSTKEPRYYRVAGELAEGGQSVPLEINNDVILQQGKHIYFRNLEDALVQGVALDKDGDLLIGDTRSPHNVNNIGLASQSVLHHIKALDEQGHATEKYEIITTEGGAVAREDFVTTKIAASEAGTQTKLDLKLDASTANTSFLSTTGKAADSFKLEGVTKSQLLKEARQDLANSGSIYTKDESDNTFLKKTGNQTLAGELTGDSFKSNSFLSPDHATSGVLIKDTGDVLVGSGTGVKISPKGTGTEDSVLNITTTGISSTGIPQGTTSESLTRKDYVDNRSYSKSESDAKFVTKSQAGGVVSVNNKTGAVILTANDVGALDRTGDVLSGTLVNNIPRADTYSFERLPTYTSNVKTYLRKFRGGNSDAIWHETIQGNSYRLATGSTDTNEQFRVENGRLYAGGHAVYDTVNKPSANDVGTYTKAEIDAKSEGHFPSTGGNIKGTVRISSNGANAKLTVQRLDSTDNINIAFQRPDGVMTYFGMRTDGTFGYGTDPNRAKGAILYSTTHKPTAADIGAMDASAAYTKVQSDNKYFPISGGRAATDLKLKQGTTITGKFSTRPGGIGILMEGTSTNTPVGGIGVFSPDGGRNVAGYMGWGTNPFVPTNCLFVASDRFTYKNKAIYHEGHKPTANDVGAYSKQEVDSKINKLTVDNITVTYDSNGNVYKLTEHHPDGNAVTTYTYYPVDQTPTSGSLKTSVWVYKGVTKTSTYNYDSHGNLTGVTVQ